MRKTNKEWIIDVIKYSIIWMVALGAATVFIVPLYIYLVDTIGGFIYLIFVLMGVLTKMFFQSILKED